MGSLDSDGGRAAWVRHLAVNKPGTILASCGDDHVRSDCRVLTVTTDRHIVVTTPRCLVLPIDNHIVYGLLNRLSSYPFEAETSKFISTVSLRFRLSILLATSSNVSLQVNAGHLTLPVVFHHLPGGQIVEHSQGRIVNDSIWTRARSQCCGIF